MLPRGAGLAGIASPPRRRRRDRASAGCFAGRPACSAAIARCKAGEYAFRGRRSRPTSVLNLLASGQTVAHRSDGRRGADRRRGLPAARQGGRLAGELPPAPPEGSLLPETYFVRRAATVAPTWSSACSAAMQDALGRALAAARGRACRSHRREDAVTLASIIEKETGQAGRVAAGRGGVHQPAAPRHAAADGPDRDLRA